MGKSKDQPTPVGGPTPSSQSGETADTLAAMEEGRRGGTVIWSIVNAIGSQAMRVADGFIMASTKAVTAPRIDQDMLAILIADLRRRLSSG